MSGPGYRREQRGSVGHATRHVRALDCLMPTLSGVILREGVRALIIDDADNVLLLRFDWLGCDVPGGFWANPGGGVEPGESRLEALQRELREEVGLFVEELGPEVWTKTAAFPMSGWDGQIDHIYRHRVAHFEPEPAMSAEQLKAENVHEIRWWPAEAIRTGDAVFAPRALPNLLPEILAAGAPQQPVPLEGF
jgi:8-oxo-dGTP diphosphatase